MTESCVSEPLQKASAPVISAGETSLTTRVALAVATQPFSLFTETVCVYEPGVTVDSDFVLVFPNSSSSSHLYVYVPSGVTTGENVNVPFAVAQTSSPSNVTVGFALTVISTVPVLQPSAVVQV